MTIAEICQTVLMVLCGLGFLGFGGFVIYCGVDASSGDIIVAGGVCIVIGGLFAVGAGHKILNSSTNVKYVPV
jgi:hypothetical protein